jgi:hypothetical protein
VTTKKLAPTKNTGMMNSKDVFGIPNALTHCMIFTMPVLIDANNLT